MQQTLFEIQFETMKIKENIMLDNVASCLASDYRLQPEEYKKNISINFY